MIQVCETDKATAPVKITFQLASANQKGTFPSSKIFSIAFSHSTHCQGVCLKLCSALALERRDARLLALCNSMSLMTPLAALIDERLVQILSASMCLMAGRTSQSPHPSRFSTVGKGGEGQS